MSLPTLAAIWFSSGAVVAQILGGAELAAPLHPLTCQVAIAAPPVQYAPWRITCSVATGSAAPMKVWSVDVDWQARVDGKWTNRADVQSRFPAPSTCWHIGQHVAEASGQGCRSEIEFLFSNPSAVSWPGHYRV